MKNVLFVCQGNMVRSQIAEALYKKYVSDSAQSAGILPETEHRNGMRLADLGLDEWIRTLREREGVDISQNICKQVTEHMVAAADVIVVMAAPKIWPRFLQISKSVVVWDGVTDDGTRIVEIIDRLKDLVIDLGTQQPGA